MSRYAVTHTPKQTQEGFIRLANVALFSDHVLAQGINPEPAFTAHALSLSSIKTPNVFVHADVIYGLTNALADVAKDTCLGLHVGERFNFEDWPPFAQALASSRTLVEFLTRYIQMVPTEVNTVHHSLLVGPDRATYRVERLYPPEVPPVQVTGFGCAQYIRIFRAVTGTDWDATDVTLASRYTGAIPPGYQGTRIATSADPGLQISFPVAWLFRELNPVIEIAQGTNATGSPEVTLVVALRSVVKDHLDQPDLGADAVARLLGLKADRLVKALKHNKTTLPKEIKRLKIDRAKEMLRANQHSIAQIGSALGYPDNAHFTRFFRSQTGMTPRAFREASLPKDK